MSLASAFQSTIIHASGITPGDWHLVGTPSTSSPDEGWDDWSGEYVSIRSDVTNMNDLLEEFPIGMMLGASNLWVTGRKISGIAANAFKMTVQAKGLLGEKGWKVRYTSSTNMQTPSGSVSLPDGLGGYLVVPKARVSETEVGAEYSAVIIGAPPTNLVGAEVDGPYGGGDFPAVKASFWNWLVNPLYTFPNGWVLQDMDADSLISPEGEALGVHLLRLRYKHVYAFSPQ